MARHRVDLFCEDSGHEIFTRALILRLARETGSTIRINTVSARGGHGKAIAELKAFQRALDSGVGLRTAPDLLVVVIDGNALGWRERRREVEQQVDRSLFPRVVVGCPDPHVERWCFADPVGFQTVVGAPSPAEAQVTAGVDHKLLLRRTILEADQPILTSAMEYAPDLLREMDLYRAGKNQPSLGQLIQDLRAELIALGGEGKATPGNQGEVGR